MSTLPPTQAPSRSWRVLAPLLLALLGATDAARAQAPAGTVTHLSGLLTARRADAGARLLAPHSVVHEGETLVTGAGTYMEVQFLDDATLIMGPDSQVQVTRYSWNPDAPATDAVLLELQRGSLRSVTGRLGKRNHDAIRIKVPGGEISVHGTDFVAFIGPEPGGVPTAGMGGLYVSVTDGSIMLSNSGGTTNFSAGQFGYMPSPVQPPVILPANPAMKFLPPPTFLTSTGTSASSSGTQHGNIDCVVR